MTIAGLDAGNSPEEQSQGNVLYQISMSRLEQLNRSAVHLIAGRLNAACPSFGKPLHELNATDLIREIRAFHEDADEFIRFDMPIKEIIFRTLLAKGNEPMALRDLHQELTVRWSNALRPITIDEALLRRVLEADTYYGFAQA